MINIKVGDVIPVNEAKSGEGKYGTWYLVRVKAEKGYNAISVWASNAAEAKDIKGAARIAEIQSVRLSGKSLDGKWFPDYSIRARLEQADDIVSDDDDDDDMPF